jgi:uncharacterized protein YbjT (DUF2867 family)
MDYRRVAVIGASGFIGRYVVQRLAQRGILITAIMSHLEGTAFLQPLGDVGQITRLRANIADEAALATALTGAEAVVNLVGILYEKGSRTFDAIHRRGTERAARLAKAAGAQHFVQVSALGADLYSPSAYARSKAAGEEAVRSIFPDAVILRPSVVFGPEDDFFNRFARLALISPALPLMGGGHTRFQPVYVGDVADAVVKALDDPSAAGKIFELGGPHIYTFRQLMLLLFQQTGRRRFLVPIPWGLAAVQGSLLGLLPNPPLTLDQVRLLQRDNVVSPGAFTLPDLGIAPTAAETILPTYMDRYRRGGWYDTHGFHTSEKS